MTPAEGLNAALDEVLRGLLSMSTERIEAAERNLSEHLPGFAGLDRPTRDRLRLTRVAALQAAQLWRGCLPQQGYTATGPEQQANDRIGLSVTG